MNWLNFHLNMDSQLITSNFFAMKFLKIFSLGLAFFLFQASFAIAQSSDSATVVPAATFEKMLKKKKNILVDVRTPEEMTEGHIENATNLDFLDESFPEKIETLNKNKTYLLYCRSGKRTAKAGAMMKAAGFKNIYMLDGGITSWIEEGKTVEK
jgi:rhodanese-related sulfurtransferase